MTLALGPPRRLINEPGTRALKGVRTTQVEGFVDLLVGRGKVLLHKETTAWIPVHGVFSRRCIERLRRTNLEEEASLGCVGRTGRAALAQVEIYVYVAGILGTRVSYQKSPAALRLSPVKCSIRSYSRRNPGRG